MSQPGPQRRAEETVMIQQSDGSYAPETETALPAKHGEPAAPAQAGTAPSNQVSAGMQRVMRRPLTVQQAGGRYAYTVDCAREGLKGLPVRLFDGVADRVRLAHLREGGTHRGAILPQNRNAYDKTLAERRERRAELGKAVFIKKQKRQSTALGGMVRSSSHVSRPRWLTIAPIAAEAATVAAPSWPGAGLVGQANAAVGGFLGDLAVNSANLAAEALTSPGGLLTVGAAAVGVTGWRALGEHRDRQDTAALLAQQGVEIDQHTEDGDAATELTRAFREAGLIKPPSGQVAGQRITLEAPVVMDSTGESWTARIVLPGSVTTAKVKNRLAELASALDRNAAQVSITAGNTEGRCVLRCWVGDALPVTGPPVPSPLAGVAVHSLQRGVPIGRDIDGGEVVLDLARGRHGLVVASSGNGKTELLKVIAASVVLDPHARLSILDGKPDGSFAQLKDLCVHFATTAEASFDERGAEILEAIADEMDDNLARAERGEEIYEHVVILDEFQEWTGNSNGAGQAVGAPKFRMRAALERLARRGRAGKIRLVLASQQYDGRTLDQAVLTNIGWRSVGYAPKKMSKDALGDLAERYGLDTSTMFVDEVQAGASVVSGGGVHPYRCQRGYLLDSSDLTRIAARAATLRAEQSQSPDASERAPATVHTLRPVPAAQVSPVPSPATDPRHHALLTAAAETYAELDAEWITAGELVGEIAVGELDWPSGKSTEMTVAAALRAAGVAKDVTKTDTGSSLTRYRLADIHTAAAQIDKAA